MMEISRKGSKPIPGKRPLDADGRLFQMALEAYRIRATHLFDPYAAVHAAQIEPLPHQLTAVYEEMLARRPLRFLLADDPGAGKTIMAGLLIKEMVARRDVERCLIVVPGNLVEQWRLELSTKFGLPFAVFVGDPNLPDASNPFDRQPFLIARMDMLSRSDRYLDQLQSAREWDLVICDEAHRMSATYYGAKVRKTGRYRLGQLLSSRCRHFLLMTATPHNGKEEDFRLFMALLDPDRFAGRIRRESHKPDIRDLMRRLTKEELLRFDGTPLFPERRAYTVQFALSSAEKELYEVVTEYVREEMDRVERFAEVQDRRRQTVGFALQLLQRRLVSSPAAIHMSLRRRRQRLEERLRQVRYSSASLLSKPSRDSHLFTAEWLDEASESEVEMEEQVLDSATAATTAAELHTEIQTLVRLERKASNLLHSGQDTKWLELSCVLDDPLVMGEGLARKVIIFTEARDTLTYLAQRIRTRMGHPRAVVEFHGGLTYTERQQIVECFAKEPDVQVLVANDAAGEGINLQCAHLMVNYDLPWNPNRLEQRFGRIHRIGQTEVCHLWNLVSKDTREGVVYVRLLEKLEEAREALGGRVYDVLGHLFDSRQLRDLMVEAIRYGEQAHMLNPLLQEVSAVTDPAHRQDLLAKHALPYSSLSAAKAATVANALHCAEAIRLQPYYVQAFFLDAFEHVGGHLHRRERGQWEITYVPVIVQRHAKSQADVLAVASRYDRICFDKLHLSSTHSATLLCPGQPLLDATVTEVLSRYQDLLQRGTVLVDPVAEDQNDPIRLLFCLEHAIQDGRSRSISKRIHFVAVDQNGVCTDMGPSPHLDLRPIQEAERVLIQDDLNASRPGSGFEALALEHAQVRIFPHHLQQVCSQCLAAIDQTEREVILHLAEEIRYWDRQTENAKSKELNGQKPPISSAQARRHADKLDIRRQQRRDEFRLARDISARTPSVVGCALVIPQGLLDARAGLDPSEDTLSRMVVERLAMDAVMQAERGLGYQPEDVSAEKRGYDVYSCYPGGTKKPRFIEVKGRACEAQDVTVTANEIRTALNTPRNFILAVVRVQKGGCIEPPLYVRQPFQNLPDPALKSSRFSLNKLLETATAPC